MRILKMLLPHITIALAVSLAVVMILDIYNPMMGFLIGRPFQVLVILEVLCAMATAILHICRPYKKRRRPRGKFEKIEKSS